MGQRTVVAALLALSLSMFPQWPARAQTACSGFKWDVTEEVALFKTPASSQPAGKDRGSAPNIALAHLYQFQLAPQDQVRFATPPGKNTPTEGSFAGLAILKLDAAGAYRVAVDAGLWIDVLVDGNLLAPKDYQGQQTCDGPHKIVEYQIPGAGQFVVQMSASSKAVIKLSITRSTPPTA